MKLQFNVGALANMAMILTLFAGIYKYILNHADRGGWSKDSLLYEMQGTHIILFNVICFVDK